MKKVFKIKFSYYWACNGQRIHDMDYIDYVVGSKMAWLYRLDRPRVRINMVKPPPGRCPHCGGKL